MVLQIVLKHRQLKLKWQIHKGLLSLQNQALHNRLEILNTQLKSTWTYKSPLEYDMWNPNQLPKSCMLNNNLFVAISGLSGEHCPWSIRTKCEYLCISFLNKLLLGTLAPRYSLHPWLQYCVTSTLACHLKHRTIYHLKVESFNKDILMTPCFFDCWQS